jgi:heme-degrading monooxygenase HmoA
MKVGLVGIHYPRPEHWDEYISRVRQAAEVLAATSGCLEVDCWLSEDNQADVSIGQWESEQAFTAGIAAARAAGVDFDYDEREFRPREILDSSRHESFNVLLRTARGRVPDLNDPMVYTAEELARAYLRASGRRRPVVPVRLPCKAARSYRQGGHLTPGHADGGRSYEEFLAEHVSGRASSATHSVPAEGSAGRS